jgi:outer membrane lipoprotein-sorting protein
MFRFCSALLLTFLASHLAMTQLAAAQTNGQAQANGQGQGQPIGAPSNAQTPAKPQPPANVPLPPRRPNAANAISKSLTPSQPSNLSPEEAVQNANAYLNAVTTMVADFTQIGVDGKRSEGKLYVQKPGKLRFQYDPPAVMEVIADGRSVAVRNRRLNTQDMAFIGQTPLKFLLKNKLDLTKDTKVLDVVSSANSTNILIEDKATFGGTSRISLIFDPVTFALRQWTVTDPQGYETIVSLFNVDLNEKPDPSLFRINEGPVRD